MFWLISEERNYPSKIVYYCIKLPKDDLRGFRASVDLPYPILWKLNNKMILAIVYAPRYVPNSFIQRDIPIAMIKGVIVWHNENIVLECQHIPMSF